MWIILKKQKKLLKQLKPLCRLRYSATHVEKFNLMYKLDSIDAYAQKLVKQIEVANVKTSEKFKFCLYKFYKCRKEKNTNYC